MMYTSSFKGYLIIRQDNPVKNKFKTKVKRTRIYFNTNYDCYFVRHDNAIWYVSPCNSLGDIFVLAGYYRDYKPGCIQKVKTE